MVVQQQVTWLTLFLSNFLRSEDHLNERKGAGFNGIRQDFDQLLCRLGSSHQSGFGGRIIFSSQWNYFPSDLRLIHFGPAGGRITQREVSASGTSAVKFELLELGVRRKSEITRASHLAARHQEATPEVTLASRVADGPIRSLHQLSRTSPSQSFFIHHTVAPPSRSGWRNSAT